MYYKNKRYNFLTKFYLSYIFHKIVQYISEEFTMENTQHDRKKFHEHVLNVKQTRRLRTMKISLYITRPRSLVRTSIPSRQTRAREFS